MNIEDIGNKFRLSREALACLCSFRARWRLLLVLPAVAASAAGAGAEDAGSFYKGKTVTVEIGVPPGGSFDAYARVFARHLGKHIPGEPTVVVSNMPGAGSRVAAAYVARQAPKDGTFIAAITNSEPLDPILDATAKLNYDPSRVNYLGSATSDVFLCVVRRGAPATRLVDMFKTPVIMGGTQATNEIGYIPILVNNFLGTKFKIVLGYPDTPSLMLAMQANEIDGNCGVTWTTIKSRYWNQVEKGEVKIVLQENVTGIEQLDELGVPLVTSYIHDEKRRRIVEVIDSQEKFGRPFFVGEDVPADRVQILRKAFLDTWRDPETIADAGNAKLDVDPISGDEVQSLVKTVYGNPPDLLQAAREAIK
jgi:tripartite-type tricarboxylate transporter receptor subunit TctC